MLEPGYDVVRDLGVAALAGLAVGIERQWSGHASGPNARFAGARTFLLLGLLGGLAGWFARGGFGVLGVLLLAPAPHSRSWPTRWQSGNPVRKPTAPPRSPPCVVLGLGAAAGLGYPLLTSAAISVTVLALVEKSRIHDLISRIGQPELEAALQFAVLALVILPLLPEGPYGPFDSIRPRALWTVVLLFSAINFVGYGARRAVGQQTRLRHHRVAWRTAVVDRGNAELFASEPGATGHGRCARIRRAGGVHRPPAAGAVHQPDPQSAVALALVPFLVPPLIVGSAFVAFAMLRHAHADEQAVTHE